MRILFRILTPAVAVVAAAALAACGTGHTGGGYISNNPNMPQSNGERPALHQPRGRRAGNASMGAVGNTVQSGGSIGTSPNMRGTATGSSSVTRVMAGKIATARYGGTVKEIESDHYHGKAAWEVEIQHSNQGRIEVKIDKATGNILDVEQD